MKSELQVSEEQVDDKMLSKYLKVMGIAPKLTESEQEQFISISRMYGLNPFKREIYCTVYGEGQYKQFSIITGYEVYIKRAERSGQLNGWNATTTGSVANGDLKAIVTIYRKDREHPFVWEVFYDECVQKTKTGNVTKFWEKANFMTKKVCISQAFRLCFSDELGGMPYTSDEMPNEELTQDIPHVEIVEDEPKALPVLGEKTLKSVLESNDVARVKKLFDAIEAREIEFTQVQRLAVVNKLTELNK